MQKLLILIVFLSVTVVGFSQSDQTVVPQNQISAGISDLPESLKGEIPPNFRTDMLAELLEMKAIVTRDGEIHPSFLDNPQILAKALLESSAVDAAFRDYITTANDVTRKSREDELLELY